MLKSAERVCTGVYLLKQTRDAVGDLVNLGSGFENTAFRPAEIIGANHVRGKVGVDEDIRRASIVRLCDAELLYKRLRQELEDVVSPFVTSHLHLPAIDYEGDQIVCYGPGDHFAPHRDSGVNFPNRYLSVVRCLFMDCDGGELQFLAENTNIKQKPGDIVVFFPELVHASLPIKSGKKIVFVSWLVSGPN